ncbi:UDP-N-acetylhexosamine pyrophosphorylase [Osmia bicornis bicornis]|uniref:UDP-N-acetylhexosamine pyrophosphorylase n=1 Tax=Osmia bicornis bicornis TaxID=1437191 RepID=UPI001EAEC112|nr:UDP-N-acetylhexosamine pyrophosphorylase [Osmia bicornis bicornis]
MESLRTKLAEYGQEHLLKFWDQLSDKEKDYLYQDISKLDLMEVTSYFQKAMYASSCMLKNTLDDKVSPIPKESIASIKSTNKKQLKAYEKLGLQEIANSRVGVLLMAGGQGTRLGVSYPKGMYNVGLPSGKTLFQLQAERILCLQI